MKHHCNFAGQPVPYLFNCYIILNLFNMHYIYEYAFLSSN
jgi:hypothetical protein